MGGFSGGLRWLLMDNKGTWREREIEGSAFWIVSRPFCFGSSRLQESFLLTLWLERDSNRNCGW